ncbi:MAG: UDP-N-acetylmuramoyl-tripeptide--D-alanyl-D-alanine ligase [Fibromonadales bacterium]|nr:UDP-N-acetylmuramoyl-tripeptide--D-alanyl-D-alanine ligase [Fibromonadales bacterium]
MSFELNITVENFLQILLQEEPSTVVAEVPQKIKMQKACLNFDSREIKQGEIFWALVGKNFNPHKGGFIEEAFKKGAVMAVVNAAEVEIAEIPLAVATEDTTRALLKFARGYRKSFPNLKVVGITGSAGKTSTKEMLAAVIGKNFNTLVTKGNLNNLFGVPMTLLGLKSEHEAAVIEMGTSLPGEILQLTQAAIPDIAVITNIAPAHLEGLGSLEGVFKEKKSIVEGFAKKKGHLVINADDNLLSKIRSTVKYNVITYGVKRGVVKPDEILWENGCAKFRVSRTWFKLSVPGMHSVYNALAAIAVGELFKIPKSAIAEALSEVQSCNMRMQIFEENGFTIISDCYNANPHSMKMSLQTLSNMPCKGRRIVVLGDMKELGEDSKKYHREIGSLLPELSVDYLVAIGSDAVEYCKGAEKAGLRSSKIKYFEDKEKAMAALKLLVSEKDMVLVKGSRSMKLEEISKKLMEIA